MVRATTPAADSPTTRADDRWRRDNVGRVLGNALRRFEARVLELLAEAGHDEVSLSQIHATRHLDIAGTRLTDMAARAAMTKQSMSELVGQLERKGLVTRRPDPTDRRARLVCFTNAGLIWLDDFRIAIGKAEREWARAVGAATLAQAKDVLRSCAPTSDE